MVPICWVGRDLEKNLDVPSLVQFLESSWRVRRVSKDEKLGVQVDQEGIWGGLIIGGEI